MTVFHNPLLTELSAGHSGPPLPAATRAYFQQRLRIRLFKFLLTKFLDAQKNGLTKAALARRIGKTPDVVNRWLASPSNLTSDTVCDLLLGLSAEEMVPGSSSPLNRVSHNYSHYDEWSNLFGEADRVMAPRSIDELGSIENHPIFKPGAADAAFAFDPDANSHRPGAAER